MTAPSFRLTARQIAAQAVIASDAKHVLLVGGSRSGKTFLAVRGIAIRAIAAPSSRHAILRFRLNHVKASIVMDTFPKVMALCFPQVRYDLNKSDLFAEFPNGAQVWFGGLDDKERTEKVLGQEYATIYLNECSQIPYSSRNIAVTRLAQSCMAEVGGQKRPLRLKMLYDCNPPSTAHWAHRLFVKKVDPEDGRPIPDPENYAHIVLNPADNVDNLPADYLKTLEGLPARMRVRFLEGRWADATAGALWTLETIEKWRTLGDLPDMQRIVVAVDPSGASDEPDQSNDAIGITVAGLGTDGNGYLLEDLTVLAGPATWGRVATSAYDRHDADLIVAEKNYGGEMVRFVIQTAKRGVPCKVITASRGKVVRAEPVASLHEQGKIRFAGYFRDLEDELCSFTTAGYIGDKSPNRADAMIWAFSELFPGIVKEKKSRNESAHAPRVSAGWQAL